MYNITLEVTLYIKVVAIDKVKKLYEKAIMYRFAAFGCRCYKKFAVFPPWDMTCMSSEISIAV